MQLRDRVVRTGLYTQLAAATLLAFIQAGFVEELVQARITRVAHWVAWLLRSTGYIMSCAAQSTPLPGPAWWPSVPSC